MHARQSIATTFLEGACWGSRVGVALLFHDRGDMGLLGFLQARHGHKSGVFGPVIQMSHMQGSARLEEV